MRGKAEAGEALRLLDLRAKHRHHCVSPLPRELEAPDECAPLGCLRLAEQRPALVAHAYLVLAFLELKRGLGARRADQAPARAAVVAADKEAEIGPAEPASRGAVVVNPVHGARPHGGVEGRGRLLPREHELGGGEVAVARADLAGGQWELIDRHVQP